MNKKILNIDKIVIGTCYYPEHWDESLWEDDLKRMTEYGISVIRIAEFAWSIFEPRENKFTFEFFDRFLKTAEKYPIKIIFGTPTATPPAWLTKKYPDSINADMSGNKLYHGLRRHYNYNSKKYNKLCARITTKLAQHYGNNKQIIGWQIDNELNCEVARFFSKADNIAFRKFLKDKYTTLANLNKAWGTVFWSQTYTSWEQIYLPRTNPKNQSNPHLLLDEKSFISDSCCRFAKLQSDILRRYISKEQFITTNGNFENLDYHRLIGESLDFLTYDSYPNFGYADNIHLKDRAWSFHLTETRSYCPVFGIMEQQVGPGGWMTSMKGPSPQPGQMRLWSYQSIANGADYIGYFRWRTSPIGTEIYWHGLNDYNNLDNRRIHELREVTRESKLIAEIARSRYKARVALIRTYANQWDAESDTWTGPLFHQSEKAIFEAATKSQTPLDIVYLDKAESLEEYSLVIWPHPVIVTGKEAEILYKYVSDGGKLVIGARTGYKDEYGRCPMRKSPGLLEKLCGCCVTDFTPLMQYEDNVTCKWAEKEYSMPNFNDILCVEGALAKAVAVYNGNYYKGMPAVISNAYGKGETLSVGAGFSKELTDKILEYYGEKSPYSNVVKAPDCCEVAVRKGQKSDYMFVLNYSGDSVNIELYEKRYDMLTEGYDNGAVMLDGYGVKIYKIN